jgi:solute carrier family 26 (sodium-independent sulfate anion transporter), member 11
MLTARLFSFTCWFTQILTLPQFHFASILSPWTRRSLVAAGFGRSSGSHPGLRHEIAPVTSFHDDFIADPEHTEADDSGKHAAHARTQDPESAAETHSSSRSSSEMTYDSDSSEGEAALVPTATPYFHFDLTAAVRAAERDSVERSPTIYGTFEDKKNVA